MNHTPPGPDRETLPSNTTGVGRESEGSAGMISPRLLSAVIVTILVLIVTVVVVGLLRGDLDVTGVATVLSTMFSGIVVGTLVKGRRDGET